MTFFYNQFIDRFGNNSQQIIHILDDGSFWIVPEDENNIDYQMYLIWLEEGNLLQEWIPEEIN